MTVEEAQEVVLEAAQEVVLEAAQEVVLAGSSGGSSDSGGGNYSGSTGYDKELKRILFEIEKNENYQGALKDLEIYVYENPQNANGWNLIGFASRKLGKFDDAELYYNTGLEIEPQHDDILAYQGELYLQTDRYEIALENLAILNRYLYLQLFRKNRVS